MPSNKPALHHGLSTVEYFTFGFGTMIGVGWLVLMDDWLSRGGPAGGMLGFLIGGLLLFPIAHTYGRLVTKIQDAGAEIAYTEGVFPPFASFAAGWTMILSYAIVCPWEAVATGNLLARVFPSLNSYQLYAIGGSPIYAPRLAVGLALTILIAAVNYRGIRLSGVFQDVMTFGLLAIFAVFTFLGFTRGTAVNMQPLFATANGPWLSIFLVLQIVPYFMTGFESVAKGSEEAKAGFDTRRFTTAIYAALIAGFTFYVLIIGVVTYVYPWQEIVSGHVRTEVAFERTFGSHAIAQWILFAAFLSLLKIFNGNFVASTRMLYAIGRRNLVHPSLGRVHARFGTPIVAIGLMSALTVAAAMFGDAILVPITEVGSLAVGVGWLSACLAYLARSRRSAKLQPSDRESSAMAWIGAAVSVAIILMKIVPGVPGSFTRNEWISFAGWSVFGVAIWFMRRETA